MKSLILFCMIVSLIIWLVFRQRTRTIIRIVGQKSWYRAMYVWTPSWRFSRLVKFFFSGRKCAKCGSRQRLDVHHRWYIVFGVSVLYWEWLMPWILQVLCRSCHEEVHG